MRKLVISDGKLAMSLEPVAMSTGSSSSKLIAHCSKLILLLLLTCTLLHSAYALGIAPATIDLDYKPGETATITLYAINWGEDEIDVRTYAKGALDDKVKLSDTQIKLKPNEVKTFQAEIKMPDTLSPGTQELRIGILTVKTKPDKTTIEAIAAVEATIRIHAPYAGKYLEASLKASDSVNGLVYLTAKLINRGKDAIAYITGKGNIYSPASLLISAATFTPLSNLIPQASGEMYAEWSSASQPSGTYLAEAVVDYDGSKTSANASFKVGEAKIDIINVSVKSLTADTARIDVDIASRWSGLINDVYADIVLSAPDGRELAKARSPPQNIEPLGNKTLSAYWDTKGSAERRYRTEINLHYADQLTTGAAVFELPPIPKATGFSQNFLLLWIGIITVVLIILIIALLAMVRKPEQPKYYNYPQQYRRKI